MKNLKKKITVKSKAPVSKKKVSSKAKGPIAKKPAAKSKVAKVLREYKSGNLHSGSKRGPVVRKRSQAVAIALSEARKAAK